jgi:phage terminase large subunit
VQETIKDSVRQLLVDKIDKFGVGDFFDITQPEIRGKDGSLIIFKGMQHYNAQNIKSLENFDIAWVEEAQTFSQTSLDMLRPTIRNDNSELWFSWNPRHKTDPVDLFFRGPHPHPQAIGIEVNWSDNPWFPQVLIDEKNSDYERDTDKAEHIWGGAYRIITEGSYYARLILNAERDGRVGEFKVNPEFPVHTSWDLGIGDATAIWWFQIGPKGPIILDYYENVGQGVDHYAEVRASKPYRYGNDYVPHDAKAREWGTARTRIEMMIAHSMTPVLVPAHKVMDGINAVRLTLPVCRFNKPTCEPGIDCLRQYRADWDDNRLSFRDTPLHDWTSHGADSFRYLSMAWRELKPKPEPKIDKGPMTINQVTIDEMWKMAENDRPRDWI